MQPAPATTSEVGSTPPGVRIVIPTHEAGTWFDSTIRSIADQDYPNLSVTLVHDIGEAELLERHVSSIAGLELIEAPEASGFGAKVNLAVEAAEEPLLLICHDDVAFEEGAISTLVREWLRRGDARTIVAPKLVDWNDAHLLMPGGFDADQFGDTIAFVRPGDLDQGQQDRVAEVFGASTAALLIEREFFTQIGAFDDLVDWHGEAHGLALRTRLAGGKVVITSLAVVRHRAAFDERGGVSEVLRSRRHRLRSVLVTANGIALPGLLLRIGLLHLIELAVALVRLDFAELGSITGAWVWNLRHISSLRERRRLLAAVRDIDHAELVRPYRGGSIRLSESVDRRVSQRELAAERGESTLSVVRVAGGFVIALILAFGARHLLTRPIPAVGEFRFLPEDLGTLTNDWWSGWRLWGMGSEGFASISLPLLDLAGIATFGSEGFLRMLLVVAPIPIGVLGAWRLFNRSGSPRAPVAAAAMYAASPLPYNALNGGSLQALFLFACLPWLMIHLVGIAQSSAFGIDRSRSVSLVSLMTLLAVVGSFVPWLGVTFAGIVVGLVIGSFLAGDMRAVPTLLGLATMALVGAALANLPYLAGMRDWAEFGSAQSAAGSDVPLVDLLTMLTGPVGSPILGWAVFGVAFLPLVSGSGQRFTWAMRVWGVMLVAWALAWTGARGWLPVGLPVNEILLTPVALGMSMLAGLSAMVIDRDLKAAKAVRALPAVVAAVAFAVTMVPLLDGSFTGRWELARVDLTTSLTAVEAPLEEGSYRVVWLADAHVLGAAGVATAENLAWTSTFDGVGDVRALWGGSNRGATAELTASLAAGLDGSTSRLGRELSRYGVRFLVVMDQQAPVPEPSRNMVVSDSRAAGLASQLDLVRTGVVNPAVIVYENTAWAPVHSAIAPVDLAPLQLDDPAPAVTSRDDHDTWSGQVRVTRSVYAAWEPSPRWTLRIDDRVMQRVDVGDVGMGFDTSQAGDGTNGVLSYATSDTHRLLLGVQVAGWIFLAFGRRWIVGRDRRRLRIVDARAERAS